MEKIAAALENAQQLKVKKSRLAVSTKRASGERIFMKDQRELFRTMKVLPLELARKTYTELRKHREGLK